MDGDTYDYLNLVMEVSSPPVLAGFGCRSVEQVAALSGYCDGVIVGSALVEVLANDGDPIRFLGTPPVIATLASDCTLAQKAAILRFIEGYGLRVHVGEAGSTTVVSIIGDPEPGMAEEIAALVGVESVSTEAPRYPFVAQEARNSPTTVKVGDVLIGGTELVVIAGPCSVESGDQIARIARGVAASGAVLLHGGAFKPRTSPYAFQGLGEEGLQLLAGAREETGLAVVSECVAPEDVDLMTSYVDMLQVGSRNMQNFRLLSAVGEQPKPVLLKRGLMSTIEELLFGRRVHRWLRKPAGSSL